MDGQPFNWDTSELSTVQNPFTPHLKPLQGEAIEHLFLRSRLPFYRCKEKPDLPRYEGACRVFALELGDLNLLSVTGSATEQVLQHTASLSLLYVTSGEVSLFCGDVHWTARAGQCLLCPGGCVRWRSSAFSVVCLMLDWTTVSDLLEALLPQGAALSAALASRSSPRLINVVKHELMASVLATLDTLLHLVSQLVGCNSSILSRLGLSHQITMLVLMLAVPELCGQDFVASDKGPADGLDAAFDDLIDYIKTHLDQELNLTLLERRSHYSRRTLQYAFRERFGCTATQWIRAQRLDLAYRLLSHPAAEASVASIAQACGYRSMSLFSIEFQRRFHRKPSLLLRESMARAQDPSP